jgi:DNA polymerase-3 subunit beta
MIRRTMFATDAESTRYALGGTLLEVDPDAGRLALVGTDGRRLARQDAPAEGIGGGLDARRSPVLPVKALKLLERVIADDDPPVHLAIEGDRAALARTDRATVYARLVEGRYPRYRDVFPKSHHATIRTTAGEMLHATEQAAITTSDESRGIDFAFGSDGLAKLSSAAADRGESAVELPVGYEGPEGGVLITFDGRYLADPLRALDPAEQIDLKLVDGKNPAVFEASDGYVFVLMPLTRDR